jgi:branched-chain amino acid transport system permease protein
MSSLLSRQREALILLGVLVIVTLAIQGNPAHLDTSVIIAIYSLLALSVGICWGQAGILSVAQAALAALGAYAAAITSIKLELSPLIGLPIAVLVPMMLAYPLARVVTRLAPLALAIATFAFSEIVYTAIERGGELTGGYIGLSGIALLDFASGPVAYHVLAWSAVLVVVVLYANLRASAVGRAWNTIRHDRIRASADGANVPHMLSSVFALSAGIAGLGGWLYAHYITYVAPESLGGTVSISVLLMAVVGGAGTIIGPVVGAAVLTILQTFLPAAEVQGLFYGAALILALLFAPKGLLGLPVPRALRTRWPRRRSEARTPVPAEEPDAPVPVGTTSSRGEA